MKNIFYYFFWWIAGANIQYLKLYPTEHEKYLHIGMTIFLTWVLANIGGIYAFSILFGNINLAILAGMVWGLIIFNLDRYMMVTIKKHGNELRRFTLAEKIGNFIKEVTPTIPRIIIALILGVIITTPLEIYLFKDQINNNMKSAEQKLILKKTEEIHKNYMQKKALIKDMKNSLEKDIDKYKTETKESIQKIDNRIHDLEKSINEDIVKLEKAQEALDLEKNGGKNEDGVEILAGKGSSYEFKKKIRDTIQSDQNSKRIELESAKDRKNTLSSDLKIQIDNYQKKIKKLQKDENDLYQKEEKETDNYKEDIKLNNFMSQIKILHSTIKKDETLFNIHIILMTLIMIFETSPILFKLLSARGPYEAHMAFLATESIIESDSLTKHVRAEFKKKHFRKV